MAVESMKKTTMPKDTNQRAAAVVARATSEGDFTQVSSVRLRWTLEAHTIDQTLPGAMTPSLHTSHKG